MTGRDRADDRSEPGVLADTWMQVFLLLSLTSGGFTAHYFLARRPLRAALPGAAGAAAVSLLPSGSAGTAGAAQPAAQPAAPSSPAAMRPPARTPAPPALRPRLAGHWLVDSADGPDADCSTLGAALDSAQDGDVIALKPGVYREPVFIRRSVVIEGSGGGPDQVELTDSGPQTLVLSGARATLRNLSLSNSGANSGWVVNAVKSRLTLERVKLRTAGEGVRVLDSDLTVADSELDARHALYAEGKSRVQLRRTTATAQEAVVLATGGGAEVQLDTVKVQDSRGIGVQAERFARVRIEGSTLTGSVSAAIFARSGAEVRVRSSSISDNRDCAVRMDGGLVTFDKVRVERDRCGVGFLGPATFETRDSRFSDLSLGALAVKPGLEDAITVRGSGNTGIQFPPVRRGAGR